ncbi:hypothetical protein E2C01_069223 [Portunus trituberculatus]|uniref:Uncharacterized protein n=1 Tax=Portunus trituberculatus TaxID=210409 RepID=A0A5B7HYN6_PORTR|nr:hypothetical protein [Portunus trituberculatus]
MSRKETVVVTLFSFLVMLWVFRDPGFIPGWATYYTKPDGSLIGQGQQKYKGKKHSQLPVSFQILED